MSDWVVIRLDLDDPEVGELVAVLPNVPLNWYDYMETKAHKTGRYVAAKILYDTEYYWPVTAAEEHRRTEESS